MYEAHYGLTARPFLTLPDPDFLYWSEGHSLAFTMLRYGLMTGAPLTVVTGDIGAGKTTLLRQLLRETPQDIEVGLVSNMQAGRGELLHWVAAAFDMPLEDTSYVALFQRFQRYVVDNYAAGRRVMVIVDEAQNLSIEQLEELRMLSNINADKDELLQLVLMGQPQLRALLARPELTQFAQRIVADFHLTPLSQAETEAYVEHRLAVAGATHAIFPPESLRLVHAAARGVPRLINVLCDLCLVYGFAADAAVIEPALLREFLSSARKRGIYTQFAAPDPQPAAVVERRA